MQTSLLYDFGNGSTLLEGESQGVFKMPDSKEIAEGLSRIFEHRQSFIVIGMTGRTGSGCTTVAEVPGARRFDGIRLPEIPSPRTSHEERKDAIVNVWCQSACPF